MGKLTLYAFKMVDSSTGLEIVVFRESEFNFDGSGLTRVPCYDIFYYNEPLGE